jgi:hypothetical protein
MPYEIKKSGAGYAIVNKNTGKVVGHSDTKAKAQSSVNARNAGAHGWKGTKK